MKVTCLYCGQPHELFMYVTPTTRAVHYACDRYPAQHKASDGTPEIRKAYRRVPYDGPITPSQLQALPITESPGVVKARAAKAQRQLTLLR